MGPAADLAWNAFWSGRTIRYSRSDHTSLEPTTFDERFDHLNHRIAKSGPLVGDRSSRYLNWRFMESPHAQHEIF
ncbi:MAG TPA: hypothetical protein VK966_08940, partial [Longimicrobiales bacterium]|nr:hypothetical protein [Longimicrobiales bacterium]